MTIIYIFVSITFELLFQFLQILLLKFTRTNLSFVANMVVLYLMKTIVLYNFHFNISLDQKVSLKV